MEITVTEMEVLQQQLKSDYEVESYKLVKRMHEALTFINKWDSEVDAELNEELALTELIENANQYLEVYG